PPPLETVVVEVVVLTEVTSTVAVELEVTVLVTVVVLVDVSLPEPVPPDDVEDEVVLVVPGSPLGLGDGLLLGSGVGLLLGAGVGAGAGGGDGPGHDTVEGLDHRAGVADRREHGRGNAVGITRVARSDVAEALDRGDPVEHGGDQGGKEGLWIGRERAAEDDA